MFLLCAVIRAGTSEVHVSVSVAFADILLFDLFAVPPDAIFIPGVDALTLAASDSPDSEMGFACHMRLSKLPYS